MSGRLYNGNVLSMGRVLSASVALIVGLLAAIACSDSQTTSSASGAIYVHVVDADDNPVSDVDVSTDPETSTQTTDEGGAVLLDKVAPGFYRVQASIGSLKAEDAVKVSAGAIARITLALGGSVVDGGNSAGGLRGSGGRPGTKGSGGVSSSSGGFSSASGGFSSGGRSTGSGGFSFGSGGKNGSGGAIGPEIDAGALDYIDVGAQVEALRADPKRPYLYAIGRPDNSISFINLTTGKVEKTTFVGSSPVDMVLDATASSLYVANYGGSQIAVVDLQSQKVASNLSVDTTLGTWQGNPYRLALTLSSTLVFTSFDQWNNLKLVSAKDGSAIAQVGTLYEPGLASSPDGTKLYVGESGSTGSKIHRFNVTATTLTEVDASMEASAYGSRLVVLSGDGKYAFYAGQKYLASNLKSVLGQFSEVIYATNGDGSIAIGSTKVFDGNTFTPKAPLPFMTQVMAISPDFKTVYLYQTTSSRIYAYDVSQF